MDLKNKQSLKKNIYTKHEKSNKVKYPQYKMYYLMTKHAKRLIRASLN